MLREGNDLQPGLSRSGKAERRARGVRGLGAPPLAGGSSVHLQTASPRRNGWRGTQSPFLSNALCLRRRAVHQDFIKDAQALWGRAKHLMPGWALLIFNRRFAATGPCSSRQQPAAPSCSGTLRPCPEPVPEPAAQRPAVPGLAPSRPRPWGHGRPDPVPRGTADNEQRSDIKSH